uniref:Uncharacterized protein n=1 Tax=Candidatus Methanogaster sp. ANME-2c ERB4 TaxID=2759911 RepID=A0A7G9YLJ3_9EURY|nr:hypothetical protein JFFFLBDL_00002 [Methanosarcinales archaeon ANME-2c ERB4]
MKKEVFISNKLQYFLTHTDPVTMARNIVWRKPHKKKYGYLKKSYRINGKVKTEEIYVGPDEVATKIGSLAIPVISISMINQVNKEYPARSRCMR